MAVILHSLGSVSVKRCGTSYSASYRDWCFMGDRHWSSNHRPNSTIDWPELQPRESVAILYAATVGSVIDFYSIFYLIRHVDAMFLIPVITPVFYLLIGHYLNNEELSLTLCLETGIARIFKLVLFEWRSKKMQGLREIKK